MASLLNKFVSRTEFESYEDFKKNFKIIIPSNFNFAYDVVDVYAAEQPEKRAIVWCDDDGGEAVFTFGELKSYSDKAANVFWDLGIRKGDTVMLTLKKHYEFWFCLLALHKIGAIAIPATNMLTSKDIIYRVERGNIKMIVSAPEEGLLDHIDDAHKEHKDVLQFKALIGKKREGWIDFSEKIENASPEFERPTGSDATQNDDIFLLYFTSGTTGLPKMVQHDFTYPLGHIITANFWQNVVDDGLHFTVADTGWAKSAWGKIYGQWISGSAVFVYNYDRFNADKLLENIIKFGVTTFCAPPTIYNFLINKDLSRHDLSVIKYCVVAGEPLNPEVYEQFLKQTGLKLMEGFGQTESVVTVATYPWMEPKPGSMGKPSPEYQIELINVDANLCEPGEEGEIVLNTKSTTPVGMFVGYRQNPELTDSVWHDGYYHTGDMAWVDEDGYFWFIGRSDDIIKSSGYRIGPFEVESALIEHPAVLECAITAIPDPIRGQLVKATVVLTKDYSPSDDLKKELQNHVKKVTAPYKYPRIIEFVTELPKTISGKIRRVEIRGKDVENAKD